MAQILIIEDEDLLAKSLARFLTGREHDCFTARTAEEGLEMLERMQMDVVLLDLQLPGISGLEAIGRLKKVDPDLVIIISTAYGTMAAAVDAMRHGASDFLRKPLDMEEVSLAVERAIANATIRRKFTYYRDREADRTDANALICNSPRMQKIKEFLGRVTSMKLPAASDYPPMLILGETGVGKDLIARLAHYHSPLGGEAFIEVNCSALPKGLEEAELFGYEKGAFTGAHRSKRGLFEAAMGGSLFLNEIGDLTAEAQVKLLDVIERKRLRRIGGLRDVPIDVRIIAATNRELKESSSFREDLYFRLNNLTIEVPPLRERTEDLLDLANLFLRQFGAKYGVVKHFAPDAEAALKRYNWPGNVREMRQLIERVTFLSPAATVHAADLNLPENRPLRVEA
ncbi:MAG TPA: sigma-54 dependent transcriptional regulator, partial [candidate division Zixibacteria bacterium]|nr:sigma-54 dependent transcriptional regulator [candidate division Zixibacteria bacterium]